VRGRAARRFWGYEVTIVVVTGDSHCAALKLGFEQFAPPHRGLDIRFQRLGGGGHVPTPFFAVENGGSSLRIVCPQWLPCRFPDPKIDHEKNNVIYAVSMPLNTSRILRDFPWGRFVPWQLRRDEDEHALSDQVLREIMWSDVKYAIEFINAMVSAKLNVVVVEAPHFFPDSQYLDHSRKEVCCFVSAAYRTFVRAQLSEKNVPVISQPASTLDQDGCTLVQYHKGGGDLHHGSAQFGAIMMKELIDYVVDR